MLEQKHKIDFSSWTFIPAKLAFVVVYCKHVPCSFIHTDVCGNQQYST